MASPISVESIYDDFDFRSSITRGALAWSALPSHTTLGLPFLYRCRRRPRSIALYEPRIVE